MLRQPDPAHLRHARALAAEGWKPHEQVSQEDVLGTVRRRDTLQHVDIGTWQLLHLMGELPVRGEVLAGNPALRHLPAGEEPLSPPRVDNGVLALVGGALVGQGSMQLPAPCLAEAGEPRRDVVVEVPSLGAVRITYELRQHRHGRSRHWHWAAAHAERVSG